MSSKGLWLRLLEGALFGICAFLQSWFFFFWQVMNFMQTQEWGLMILDGECSTFLVPKTSIHWNAKKASCLDNPCWPFFRRLCYFLFWIHDIHLKTVHFKNAFSIECREPKPGGWIMKNTKGTFVWDLKFKSKIPKAPEDVGNQVLIDFGLASNWLRGWRKFSGPITKRSEGKPTKLQTTSKL